jgi:DNA polymerase
MFYCHVDAKLSYRLARLLMPQVGEREIAFSHLTMDMNVEGWPVDMELVREMNRQYKFNVASEVKAFRHACAEPELNLNSHTQLIAWCKARGVTARSFDEKNVASMLRRIDKRLLVLEPQDPQAHNLHEVKLMLLTKQVLGGSSLKKLDTIENMVSADGRLRNQYMHVGAGATFRTSGRGVQMQNLKRLHGEGDDVNQLLYEHPLAWSNDKLATNLRQVFAASDPFGSLIVGDFSSVESRGLAWQAGEEWKLDAYHAGQDLYMVQASMMFNVPVESITKDQRQVGKVGELACGYGAGPDAVKDFAEKMGVELSLGEATKLVRDWRDANSKIVEYWGELDAAMHGAITSRGAKSIGLKHGAYIVFHALPAPESLRQQVKDDSLQTLHIRMYNRSRLMFTRVVHGVSIKGRNVTYWKPSERKTGDLWSNTFTDPKTKQRKHYSLYGGKLSGLLTQSLCREVFFTSLQQFSQRARSMPNVRLIGQFHDEIVVEW